MASLSQSVRQLSAVVGLSAHALQDHWQDTESGCSSSAGGTPLVQNVSGGSDTGKAELSVNVQRAEDRAVDDEDDDDDDAQQVLDESAKTTMSVDGQESSNQSGGDGGAEPNGKTDGRGEMDSLAGAFSALERVFSLLHGITAGLDAADARRASAGGANRGADDVSTSVNVSAAAPPQSPPPLNGTRAAGSETSVHSADVHEDAENLGQAGNAGGEGETEPLGTGEPTTANAGATVKTADATPQPSSTEATGRNEVVANAENEGDERVPAADLGDREPVSMAITSIDGGSSNAPNDKNLESD